ncbi:GNAT family N-acetyltransferase [Stutzerimonas azotifigens]|uniref:GNAT family N-acetyltransferase n=1 Tax=Stutzerimonas azotifigens TaxID=291995 RepID=UPI0003FA3A4E|nr:GNAT family N-acetyltransferase [Stutzerimonas azotifigens]
MNRPAFARLEDDQKPLLDKFYRAHRSPMRAGRPGCCWVARRGEIVGGLNLRPVAGGLWLTGLLVAPAARRQGVGRALLGCALDSARQPVWLFCAPELAAFYADAGFAETMQLPPELAERLARYRQRKPLLALCRSGMPPTAREPRA